MREGPPIPYGVTTSLPRVEIKDVVLAKDCPYRVSVDPQKFLDLLVFSGIPINLARTYSLHINRESPPTLQEKANGSFRPLHRQINLFLDNCGPKYFQETSLNTAATLDTKSPIVPFSFLGFTTARLPSFIANRKIPYKRKLAFMEKLFTAAMQKQIKRTLIHEVSHAVYELIAIAKIFSENPEQFPQENISKEDILRFLEEHRKIDWEESEQDAQQAVTKKLEADQRFDNIVTIIPKKSWIYKAIATGRRTLRDIEKELDSKYPAAKSVIA